jgi:hypothetical protein
VNELLGDNIPASDSINNNKEDNNKEEDIILKLPALSNNLSLDVGFRDNVN